MKVRAGSGNSEGRRKDRGGKNGQAQNIREPREDD
jgi:hypothetical protein